MLHYGVSFQGLQGLPCVSVSCIRLQLLLKPTSGKPMKRDGIPRSNEFSAAVSSYSLPKDLSRFCHDSVGFLPLGTFESGCRKSGNKILMRGHQGINIDTRFNARKYLDVQYAG